MMTAGALRANLRLVPEIARPYQAPADDHAEGRLTL
jgi:hypothetical protein